MWRRGRKGPDDQDLFRVAKELRVPTSVEFLSHRLGIAPRTLDRYLRRSDRKEPGYLEPIVEGRDGLYWLLGYPDGEPAGLVAVPKDIDRPTKWFDLYVRLGWQPHSETPGHFILLQGQATSEPDEDMIPSNFRVFRDLVLVSGYDLKKSDEEFCSNFFRDLCRTCSHEPYKATTLQDLCPACASSGSYELVKQKLEKLGIFPRKELILTYISYEYKKELLLLTERMLRELYVKPQLPDMNRLNAAFKGHYRRMMSRLFREHSYDPTLERELLEVFPHIVAVTQEEAAKAIKITLDAARWHEMDEPAIDPFIVRQFEPSYERYVKEARPIIEKALRLRL